MFLGAVQTDCHSSSLQAYGTACMPFPLAFILFLHPVKLNNIFVVQCYNKDWNSVQNAKVSIILEKKSCFS